MTVDLKEFSGLKGTWSDRKKVIQEKFPSTVELDWERVFRSDPHILGQLINDILKVDLAVPGRPGKRPALDSKAAGERLRRMVGDDYTALPFVDAVYILMGDHSVLWLAQKTGLNKSHVYRIMSGHVTPTMDNVETVAKAFGKDPSYFTEYRLYYILGVMSRKLESMPDSTVGFYKRMKDA